MPPVSKSVSAHLESLGHLRESVPTIGRIVRAVKRALASGGTVLTCGNGGSAAEALHLAEEMVGRFSRVRAPLAALCLAADSTALTCIANDFGYESVFARQVEAVGRKGDVLIALSTSGRSANVLRALKSARRKGLTTIGLLGQPGAPAEKLCDIAFTSPARSPAHVQEMHLVVIHLLLERLDEAAPAARRG